MFLTIIDGDYTININLISEIDWTVGKEHCRVTMTTGKKFDLIEDDFHNLREKLGIS